MYKDNANTLQTHMENVIRRYRKAKVELFAFLLTHVHLPIYTYILLYTNPLKKKQVNKGTIPFPSSKWNVTASYKDLYSKLTVTVRTTWCSTWASIQSFDLHTSIEIIDKEIRCGVVKEKNKNKSLSRARERACGFVFRTTD